MCTMEWKEVEPEQKDWEKRVDIVAYYGSVTIGSIVYSSEIGWQSVIDGYIDCMQAKSLEDAKIEMISVLYNHCTDQINYYKELQESLDELNEGEVWQMAKAVLVMDDMPESCAMCDFVEEQHPRMYCGVPGIGEDVTDYIACRPDFCPLRELPEHEEDNRHGERVQQDTDECGLECLSG